MIKLSENLHPFSNNIIYQEIFGGYVTLMKIQKVQSPTEKPSSTALRGVERGVERGGRGCCEGGGGH